MLFLFILDFMFHKYYFVYPVFQCDVLLPLLVFNLYHNLYYQLLAHGRWLSPGTPAFFTTKTGRHDIAEILLKVA
jgi:hypothetical protein